MAEFRRAPEVAEIGRDLIEQYHRHLLEVRMEYVFGDEAPESNGTVTRGKAVKVSGVNAELARLGDKEHAEDFFCIVIFHDQWTLMKPKQQRALVDHELEHCKWKFAKDGSRKLYLKDHDLEEFHCIVARHGFWKRDVDRMFRAMQKGQTIMPFEEPGVGPSEESSELRKTEIRISTDDLDKLHNFNAIHYGKNEE